MLTRDFPYLKQSGTLGYLQHWRSCESIHRYQLRTQDGISKELYPGQVLQRSCSASPQYKMIDVGTLSPTCS